jgi:hypothetical protein
MIPAQDSENLSQGLRKKGIEPGQSIIPKQSQQADVNGKFFAEYAESTFVPDIMMSRVDGGIEEQEAMLRMGNCPSHITGDVMHLLKTVGVRVQTLAPHTT